MKDQEDGGQGETPTFTCLSPGMPRVMNAYEPFEIVVTPQSTHFLMDHIHDSRRILTDGRDWPADPDPSFAGYSIGRWVDEDGDGRFDTLVVETRALRGPRSYDSTGIPFHRDNQTIIKERIYLDPANKDTLYDEITVIDHALTRPWTNDQEIRPRHPQSGLAGIGLRRGQPARRDRGRALHAELRRLPHAARRRASGRRTSPTSIFRRNRPG